MNLEFVLTSVARDKENYFSKIQVWIIINYLDVNKKCLKHPGKFDFGILPSFTVSECVKKNIK